MNWIKDLFKIFSYNISILSILIILLYLVLFTLSTLLSEDNKYDSRLKLINYKNYNWAEDHFKELNSLKTSYKDYYTWRRDKFKGKTININFEGIRNSVLSKNINNESQSFMFFGGSSMWGTGSDDKNTIPSIFSEINNVNVINYAETGYTAIQSLNFLSTLLIKDKINIKDKIVIFYDGVNNVAYNCQTQNLGLETTRQIKFNKLQQENNFRSLYYYIKPYTFYIQKLKNYFFQDFVRDDYRDCDNNLDKAERVSQNLINTWLLTKNLVENNGGIFIPVLQPVIYVGNIKKNHLQNLEIDLGRNYEIVYDLIIKKSTKIFGNNFIDLTNSLDDQEFYYIDYCHLSPNGNFLIANQITSLLKKQLKIEF